MARSLFRAVALLFLAGAPALAADEKPVDVQPFLDSMQQNGSRFDAAELQRLGLPAMSALLDRLLPDTVPAPKDDLQKIVPGLIGQLSHENFDTREQATLRLIAIGRGHRAAITEATRSTDPEVRQRAQRILAAWEGIKPLELGGYTQAFSVYLQGIKDRERLDLLAERTVTAFQRGMPEGDRREVLRLAVAAVARGGDDKRCDRFRPLLQHADVRVPALVVNTVGGCKENSSFFPRLLLDALDCERPEVVQVAILWAPDPPLRVRAEVRRLLVHIFTHGSEPLKFEACFPLMHTFRDEAAYRYLMEQAQNKDPERARIAMCWLGDSRNWGRPVTPELLDKLVPHLKSTNLELRRAAACALGTYRGEKVIQNLVPLLADPEAIVVQEVSNALQDQAQTHKATLIRCLEGVVREHVNPLIRTRAKELLDKVEPQPGR
jgi:HEAT repeat protein